MSEELARRLLDVLANRVSLRDFQRWFIPYALSDVHPEDEQIALDLENVLAQFTGGHISEPALRAELQTYAVKPIVCQGDNMARER